jgi:prepilin-type N-terminal cleavage/methylation domain-containing protein
VSHHEHRRPGFTAIEMLVVIAIVGLLAAITAGAVIRTLRSQEESFTETTIEKLASALDVQWKKVIDTSRRDYEALPNDVRQNLIEMADNAINTPGTPKPHPRRDDRARLLYMKFRLQQEFPNAFDIAVRPAQMTGGPTGVKFFLPAAVVPGFLSNAPVTGKADYVRAVAAGNTLKTMGVDPNAVTAPGTSDRESAALLLLVLEKNAGVAVEQLVGSNFIATDEATGLRYLIDSWGRPLRLFIFPAATDEAMTDLIGTDQQDPEGLLAHPSAPPQPSRWTNAVFGQLLHPQLAVGVRRMVPTIVSSGPDGRLGMYETPTRVMTPPQGGFDGRHMTPFVDTDTRVTSKNLTRADRLDNIYSFRLRQTGARGN